jgi:hypothetical protein
MSVRNLPNPFEGVLDGFSYAGRRCWEKVALINTSKYVKVKVKYRGKFGPASS